MAGEMVAVLTGLVGTALGAGGGITAWVRLRELKDKRDESELGRLRDDMTRVLAGEARCREELAEVRERLEVVEHHHNSYLARWIVDARHRIVWVNNRALISIFALLGYARTAVVGRSFADLLEIDAADELDRLGRRALAHPGHEASTLVQLHYSLPKMVVVVVAGIGRDDELIYEGYAYCPPSPEEVQDRGERRAELQLGASTLKLSGPDNGEAGTAPA